MKNRYERKSAALEKRFQRRLSAFRIYRDLRGRALRFALAFTAAASLIAALFAGQVYTFAWADRALSVATPPTPTPAPTFNERGIHGGNPFAMASVAYSANPQAIAPKSGTTALASDVLVTGVFEKSDHSWMASLLYSDGHSDQVAFGSPVKKWHVRSIDGNGVTLDNGMVLPYSPLAAPDSNFTVGPIVQPQASVNNVGQPFNSPPVVIPSGTSVPPNTPVTTATPSSVSASGAPVVPVTNSAAMSSPGATP